MMLALRAVATMIVAVFFKRFLSGIEVRSLVFWSIITQIMVALGYLALIARLNLALGIPDYHFVVSVEVFSEFSSQAFFYIPITALWAIITPKNVEGTIFSLLSGVNKFSTLVMSRVLAAGINTHFVGVLANDLSKLPQLFSISLGLKVVSLLLLPLIPTTENIREWKEIRE